MGEPSAKGYFLRQLERRDIKAISQVHSRACLVAYKFMNWSYSLSEVVEWYEGRFTQWTWTRAAVDKGGDIAGYIALRDRHIDQLFIDPAAQQAGIGSALLNLAIRQFPGKLTLDVFEANKAARVFYEKHGFKMRDRWMNAEEGVMDLLYVRD